MRLHRIELENLRRFDRPHRVDGFGPGINVLAGPNEHGKSTLLAALHAVLFLRHGSRDRQVAALRPFGHETAPRVALGFELDGVAGTLEKRFLGRPSATLALGGRRWEGDAAERELRAMLGLDGAAATGRGPDPGIWEALLVRQGEAAEQPRLDGPNEAAAVLAAIEAELGAVTGSGHADAVLLEAERALGEHRGARGQPRERAKAVVDRLAAIESEDGTLAERARTLADDGARLRAEEAALARLRATLADPAAVRALDAARDTREEARTRAARLASLDTERSIAIERRDATALRLAEREQLRLKARDAALIAQQAAAAEADAVRAHADASRARGDAADRQAAARTAEADARAARDRAEARRATGQHRRAHDTRAAMLAEARIAEAAVRDAAARLDALPVDEARLRAVRTAADRLERARDDRRARAGTLRFDPAPGGAAAAIVVERDGAPAAPLDAGTVVALDGALSLRIEGVGLLRFRPPDPVGPDAVAVAAAALETALRDAGAADVAAAERGAVDRDRAATTLAEARARLRHLAPGDAAIGLAPGTDALADEVARLRAAFDGAATEGDGTSDAASLDRALTTARDALADAETACRAAEELASGATARAVGLERDAAAARVTALAARRAATAAADALDEATGRVDDYALAEAGARADADAVAAIALVDAARRADGAEPDIALLSARIERLEDARRNDNAEFTRLTGSVASLRARIEAAGGSGLDEARAALERERVVLARERAAIDAEVASLVLLIETLRAEAGAARDTVLAPLRQRTARSLGLLLPGALPSLGDDYAVSTLDRGDGRTAEPFTSLSHGTREQIAVLARLALADLLRAAGKPALLVLDDALVFADGERIDRMFDILHEAASRLQIVVLTCRADLFDRLGGTRLRIEPVTGPA